MPDAVLVTGATGFIGRHLVDGLRRGGHGVRTVDRRDGDIATCQPDLAGVTHVFHLAGRSFVPASWRDPAAFYATNVLGTINVLEWCRRAGASLTFVSSYVYGRPQRLPIDERHPRQAVNPYAHSKILAEEAVEGYRQLHGLTAVIVRPFNVYGPGQRPPFLIPSVVEQALDERCEAITIQDAAPRRDYLYVGDLVDLLVATVRPAASHVFNAGSGGSLSVGEVVEAIRREAAPAKPVRVTGAARAAEIPDVVADVTQAGARLGWRPRVTFAEGLRRTVEGMRTPAEQR